MYKYTKYITLIMMGLTLATQTQAACNGGTTVDAHTTASNASCANKNGTVCNGETFCVSNNAMNWWSAMAWCKANGMQLASVESLCPATGKSGNGDEVCQNLTGRLDVGNLWTRTILDEKRALQVAKGYDKIYSGDRSGDGWGAYGLYAACEEISSSN